MSNVASIIPDASDLLCEGCGYTLKGLPESGNCPECGKPIDESVGKHRGLSEFEMSPSPRSFWCTTAQVIFSPGVFYRTLMTREQTPASIRFARIHRAIAALLFSLAAVGHFLWVASWWQRDWGKVVVLGFWVVSFVFIWLMMNLLTRLATSLSAIEARYWGMRLPYDVVARGMAFHTANYLPVGLLAILVIWGYRAAIGLRWLDQRYDPTYLFVLSGVVVVCAFFTFQAYWISMRSMRYANR